MDHSHAARIVALWNHPSTNLYTQENDGDDDDDGLLVFLFLPSTFLWNHVMTCIVMTFMAVSILYYILFQYFPIILKFVFYIYPPNHNHYVPSTSSVVATTAATNMHHHPHNNNNKHQMNNKNNSRSSNNHTNNHTRLPTPSTPTHQTPWTFSKSERQKLCYQMTNFIVNLCFSGWGLYYEFVYNGSNTRSILSSSSSLLLLQTPPQQQSDRIPVEATIVGYNDFVYISAAQIGYQLWSIPIGIYLIQESIPMIVHHVTVIVCASMSGFLRYGFRYYTPFFYGMVELSSLPLAMMNAFKDHPNTLQYYYPKTNANIRYLFAAIFLYIRIVLFIPKKYCFLRDHILLWTSIRQRYPTKYHDDGTEVLSRDDARIIVLYQCFMAIVSFSAFFLLLLQIYWAVLIMKGILKLFLRPNDSPSKRRTGGTNDGDDDEQKLKTT